MSGNDIDNLIDMMARLPGLGPRSARRAVLPMIRKRAMLLTPLADLMQSVSVSARDSLTCGNVRTTHTSHICADPGSPT